MREAKRTEMSITTRERHDLMCSELRKCYSKLNESEKLIQQLTTALQLATIRIQELELKC
jgi:hypothetical protein